MPKPSHVRSVDVNSLDMINKWMAEFKSVIRPVNSDSWGMEKVAIIKAFGQSNMLQNTTVPLDQEFLVGNLIENEHFTHHSPPVSYRRKFWKWIIQNIESNEEVSGNKAG